MCDEEINPCAYCPYATEVMDSVGHTYYQCELDDDTDNHLNARCVGVSDDN